MVINSRQIGPGGRRLDNVLILFFWEGGHITVHVRPISITLPHCRPMIPPKHAFTWSCVDHLLFIPLGSDVFWAIVAIAGRWRRSTTGARRRMSPRLRRITLRFLLMGQPVHEEKRCRGWADGTSKSSSWWAAAAGRMSTLIVIAGHHTRHATLPHFSTFTFVCAQNHQPVENGRQFSFVLRSTYLSKTIQGF